MASGFGIIDYVVVLFALVLTSYFLTTAPKRLLLFLPALLTVDFFIPFGSQLTPSRLVPLMIGVWLLLNHVRFGRDRAIAWIPYALYIIVAGLLYGLAPGDAGSRPVFRALNYLNLIFIFLFVYANVRDRVSVDKAVWGLVLAGMLHAGYAAYQIVAQEFGLPYRGIVYNELSGGVISELSGSLRVNGLADEPKRLGYILFSSALAATWLLTTQISKPISTTRRYVLITSAVGCLGISVLTYSSSYFLAVIGWMLAYFLISRWSRRMIFLAAVMLGVLSLMFPSTLNAYASRFNEIVQARSQEVARGLDGRFVYRQEFYAQAYLEEDSTAALFGVGLGRYNEVFRQKYGFGAGYGSGDTVLPLNSQAFEVVLDFGLAGLLLLYGGAVLLILRLGFRDPQRTLAGAIVSFLALQSIFISNLPYLAFSMGAAAALISVRSSQRNSRSMRFSVRRSFVARSQ